MGIYASPSGLLIAERDPTLALYPIALNDFATGNFLDAVTNINATTSGGSTLTGQAKFRNDYQRLTSDFPSLGYRASGAVTNLSYASNNDNPSFEGGTAGDWSPANATHAVSTLNPWHGSYCLVFTATGANAAESLTLTGFTANAQHTAAIMVRANNAGAVGESVELQLIGDVSGTTSGTAVTLTSDWKLATCTKTFAGDSARTATLLCAGSDAGDEIAVDAFIIVTGATVPMFEESECVATSRTFPTPFTAGEPVSFLFFVWTPWAGNDGVDHYLLDTTVSGTNRVFLYKTAASVLTLRVNDAAGANKNRTINVDAANWPAGTMKAIAGSLTADNTMRLALGGTLSAAGAGAGVRETAIGANLYAGTSNGGVFHTNGIILPYIYRGVAWGDAECEYYSTLQAPPPRTRMVF